MSLCQNTKFRRSAAAASQEVASATFVLPTGNGAADLDAIFSFNPIGAELWQLMGEGVSVTEMASWVESQYDVSRETALEDIQKFVDALDGAGLASIASEPSVRPAIQETLHASRRN